MLLIALAGLPGTGKSTLARALAPRLGARLLDKDELRAALFAPDEIEYSRAQDDLVMGCVHRLVEFHARAARLPALVLDGRTYSRRAQVEELCALARRCAAPLAWIECVAAPEEVRRRLALDAARGTHPAANRCFELYQRLAAEAESLVPERLVLETDRLALPEQLERALSFLSGARAPGAHGE